LYIIGEEYRINSCMKKVAKKLYRLLDYQKFEGNQHL